MTIQREIDKKVHKLILMQSLYIALEAERKLPRSVRLSIYIFSQIVDF